MKNLESLLDGRLKMNTIFALFLFGLCASASAEDDLVDQKRKPASTTLARPTTLSAPALEAPDEEPEYSDLLLGDWNGARKNLQEKGIDFKIRYKGDVARNFAGGLKPATVYLGNLDLNGEFDFEKLAGLKGTTLVLYGLANHGNAISKVVGDSFVTDNIEAPSTFKLYEAYIQQALDDRLAILLGLRDLNADFDATPTATLFLNGAFGTEPTLSQTGLNGPSIFPVTALAGTLHYQSPEHIFFNAGIFNARAGDHDQPYGTHISSSPSDGYLLISELGATNANPEANANVKAKRAFKYSAGGWTYTKPVDTLDSDKDQGQNWGLYAMADQKLTDTTAVFLRYGMAAPAVNKLSANLETGLVFEGLIPGREKDRFGLGLAHLISRETTNV